MTRTPRDQISQRRLVNELRVAIDRSDGRAIRRLVDANPNSVTSTHVIYNLGKARALRLSAFVHESRAVRGPLPIRSEA
jgi:hypothetical protein